MTESSKINTAIARAMIEVQKLPKDDRNEHGNYSFASIDQFLDACRPICAAHGLHPNIDGVASDTFLAGNAFQCNMSRVKALSHPAWMSCCL